MSDNFFKIPNGWHLVTLEKISKFITKGATPTTYGFDWSDEARGIPFLRSECVTLNGFNPKGMSYISLEAHNVMERSKIVPGDILMTITGNIGRIAMLPNDIPEANINQHISRISIRDEFYSDFVFQALRLEFYSRYYERILTGQAYPQISLKQVRETPILLPSYEEQKLIAAILFNFDRKIELIDNKISETKKLKNGLVQKLFSEGIGVKAEIGEWIRHKKFKDSILGPIPQNWKIVSLKEILDVIKDGTHFSPKSSDGQYKYLTSKNIRFGKLDLTNVSYINEEEHNRIYKSSPVKPGDILLTKDGANTGNAAINSLDEPFSLLSSVAYLRGSKNKISHAYLLQFLLSSKGQSMLKSAMTGQAITRLTLKKIGDFKIPYPNVIEQKQIAEILCTVDEKLNTLEKQRSETHLLKKGLMQKLLTGEWRVPVDCNEVEAA